MPLLDTVWAARKRVADERLKICNECEHFQKDNSRCKKCGCFMNYKSLIMSSSCPINKWQSYKE